MRERAVDRAAAAQGWLLGAATLVVYGWLAPTWIVGGDNAELVTIGAQGGVPHPSGYPLYVLYLRALAWLPAASAAHAAALATALLAAIHVVVLHAACRAWGARAAAATLAVGVYAASPLALLIYSQAEVFALNALAAAVILWLAAPAGPVIGGRRVVLLGLAAGLALSNHLTAVLLAPIGIHGAVRGLREATGRRLAISAGALGALGLGLTPYLYLLIAPSGGMSWGQIDGLGALFDHATRREYGSASLAPTGEPDPGAHLAGLGGSLARAWLGVLLAVGVVALVAGCVRGAARGAWIALAVTTAAACAIIAAFNLGTTGVDAWIVERFHLLPALVFAIPVAVGIDRIAARAQHRIEVPVRTRRLLAVACFVVFPLAVAPGLDHVRRGHSPAVARAADNLLAMLPPDAVVLTAGDHLHFAIGHAQLVGGARPDVVHMTPDILTLPWYRARITRRLGYELIPPGDGLPSQRLAENLIAHGRPVFVDADQRNIIAGFPSYPQGPVFRVLPRGTALPPLDDILAINRAAYARFDLRYPRPGRGDGWAALVHQRYAAGWRALAAGLERAGRDVEAAEAMAMARALAPE